MNEHVVNRVEVETSRIIKKITLEKTNQEKINHKTKNIKISQNQYTDKVVDVTVVIQKQVSPRIKRRTERVGELDSTSGLELYLRNSERKHATFSARHSKMKAHSKKLMNVSDMQVPDEDDRFPAQPPPHDQSEQQDRERVNLDAQFPFRQQTAKS